MDTFLRRLYRRACYRFASISVIAFLISISIGISGAATAAALKPLSMNCSLPFNPDVQSTLSWQQAPDLILSSGTVQPLQIELAIDKVALRNLAFFGTQWLSGAADLILAVTGESGERREWIVPLIIPERDIQMSSDELILILEGEWQVPALKNNQYDWVDTQLALVLNGRDVNGLPIALGKVLSDCVLAEAAPANQFTVADSMPPAQAATLVGKLEWAADSAVSDESTDLQATYSDNRSTTGDLAIQTSPISLDFSLPWYLSWFEASSTLVIDVTQTSTSQNITLRAQNFVVSFLGIPIIRPNLLDCRANSLLGASVGLDDVVSTSGLDLRFNIKPFTGCSGMGGILLRLLGAEEQALHMEVAP